MAWRPTQGRHFAGEDIRAALTWDSVVASQRDVFAAYSLGEAELATRGLLSYGGNTAFSYLARASRDGWPVVKIGSVNPGNRARGLPTVHALVLVMDKVTGEVAATMDGETITTMRTPAASVAAIEALAGRPEDDPASAPERITVVGGGRQGLAHVELLLERYPSSVVTLVGRDLKAEGPGAPAGGRRHDRLELSEDTRCAVRSADVVILCTSSFVPVIRAEWLQPGATLVSIGSFAPDRHEFGADVVGRAGVIYVDDAATACRQCGPVAAAVASGDLARDRVHSIGEVITGRIHPEAVGAELTVYASVGLGIQDAAVVDILMAAQTDG